MKKINGFYLILGTVFLVIYFMGAFSGLPRIKPIAVAEVPASANPKNKPIEETNIVSSSFARVVNKILPATELSWEQEMALDSAKLSNDKEKLDEFLRTKNYIKRFKETAKVEEEKYNIPFEVILAQGILESNSGTSNLAKSTNNHFGIKCFSGHCKKGHCKNFMDDTHKDFFKVYQSPWFSFREHSKFILSNPRYKKLFKLSNPEDWAIGLKKEGYATDKNYDDKLIYLFNKFKLSKLK